MGVREGPEKGGAVWGRNPGKRRGEQLTGVKVWNIFTPWNHIIKT
jgi:hypothetical protein